MHDESAGGKAVYDRALAYWTDPRNFDVYPRVGTPVPGKVRVEEPVQDRLALWKTLVFWGVVPSPMQPYQPPSGMGNF
jgi:hypothetical protein